MSEEEEIAKINSELTLTEIRRTSKGHCQWRYLDGDWNHIKSGREIYQVAALAKRADSVLKDEGRRVQE